MSNEGEEKNIKIIYIEGLDYYGDSRLEEIFADSMKDVRTFITEVELTPSQMILLMRCKERPLDGWIQVPHKYLFNDDGTLASV